MIRLVDYIKECLKDQEFKEIWERENSDLDPLGIKKAQKLDV